MKLKNILFVALFATVCTLSAQQTRFRLAINGGLGYRIAKIQDNVSEEDKTYLRGLKSGGSYDIEAVYMVQSSWGLGMQFSNFRSKGSTITQLPDDTGVLFAVPTTDDISITYIGPQYLTKNNTSDGAHSLIASISLGYLGIKNAATLNTVPLTFKSATVGFGIGMGYEYRISENIGIGAKLGVIGGSISKYDVTAVGRTETLTVQEISGLEREGLTRIDLLGGIRFYL